MVKLIKGLTGVVDFILPVFIELVIIYAILFYTSGLESVTTKFILACWVVHVLLSFLIAFAWATLSANETCSTLLDTFVGQGFKTALTLPVLCTIELRITFVWFVYSAYLLLFNGTPLIFAILFLVFAFVVDYVVGCVVLNMGKETASFIFDLSKFKLVKTASYPKLVGYIMSFVLTFCIMLTLAISFN